MFGVLVLLKINTIQWCMWSIKKILPSVFMHCADQACFCCVWVWNELWQWYCYQKWLNICWFWFLKSQIICPMQRDVNLHFSNQLCSWSTFSAVIHSWYACRKCHKQKLPFFNQFAAPTQYTITNNSFSVVFSVSHINIHHKWKIDITTKDWFIIIVWYGLPSGSYGYTTLWNKPHNWSMYVSDTSDSCFTRRTVTDTARYTEFAASCATAAAATTAATAAAAKWTETVSDSSHYSVTGTYPSCNYSTKTSTTTAFEISRSFCTLCFVLRRFKIINCAPILCLLVLLF